jgi:hypothetical protein
MAADAIMTTIAAITMAVSKVMASPPPEMYDQSV